ncbi:glycerol-3-phosphate dehydrogenase/oxidase [candidate division KSB1 bacterium]|nr:glycerol-3-phosphate dehydrogenase/oxidase [candidate division KSB1 bacterium]
MTRNFKNYYDLLIIGGGIYGAAIAWIAASRGLSVALVEKGDFAGATSGNSLKIIHGGLRYLQQLDIKRVRESIAERKKLLQIAPHLIHPLTCLMPTIGLGMKGMPILSLGLLVNDIISLDRNIGMDAEKYLPRGKVMSRQKMKQILPFLSDKYTGAALWTDAQVYNSERLVLAYIKSAKNAGATVFNYAKVDSFLRNGRDVIGAQVNDLIQGLNLQVRAKMTVTATGPWTNSVLELTGESFKPFIPSKAMNILLRRRISPDYAFAVSSGVEFRNGKKNWRKKSRQLFITPWRDVSIVGTSHLPYNGSIENFRITITDIQDFLLELNEILPGINLDESDVSFFHGGVLPLAKHPEPDKDVELLKHYKIIDFSKKIGIGGLSSVIGVKYTTARDVAEKVVEFVMSKLNFQSANKIFKNVIGGEILNFKQYMQSVESERPGNLSEDTIRQLVLNYGDEYRKIVQLVGKNPLLAETLNSAVITAQIVFAVREEMAFKLSDVILRRTELGSAICPEDNILQKCAKIMAKELGWSAERTEAEIEEVKQFYTAADKRN